MTDLALALIKGHGTGNDFLVLPDPEGAHDLAPGQVAALCHRRTGLGADGVLRAVPSSLAPEAADQAHEATWFMDYRNADGSLAEMCGNGLRVFARYLVSAGLEAAGSFRVATRAGAHSVVVPASGDVAVTLAAPTTPRLRAMPVVSVPEGGSWSAVGVLAPNPHAVAFVGSLDEAGALTSAPEVAPQAVFPDGVNVEFVVVHGPDHVSMRVHERGSGETLSCGTGAVAVAWAARRRDDLASAPATVRVDVPGGTLQVTEQADGQMVLAGPAVLVADIVVDPVWWAGRA